MSLENAKIGGRENANHICALRDPNPDVFNDHPPPHFHARYGEFEATIDIGTAQVMEGQLPIRALNLVQEWPMMHKGELLEDWQLCREKTSRVQIEPLP